LPSSKAIREGILARRNDHPELIPSAPVKKLGKLKTEKNCHKTPLMLWIERFHRRPVEELVWDGSISEVAGKLELSETTVTYWRRKFPLGEYRAGPNNRKYPVSKSS